MGLHSRLRRLEETPEGCRCLECRLPPDGPGRIVHDRIPEGAEEVCLRCGRTLWFVIRVVEGEDEEEEVATYWLKR